MTKSVHRFPVHVVIFRSGGWRWVVVVMVVVGGGAAYLEIHK